MNLERDTLLLREPELRLALRPSGELEIERDGVTCRAGRGALSALEVFSKPTSLESALQSLVPSSAGSVEGLEILETIFGLLNAGILRRADGPSETARSRPGGFDTVPIHIRLLNDRTRTSRFLSAISEVVTPGDSVLDIGTGTGILSVAAARAGARKVYAVESGEIALQASRLFKTSGYSDRISLLRGWSYGISLPEPADVLVTETIGDDPLDERILDVVADARSRLLREGARVIPASLDVFVQAFQIPERELRPLTFGPEAVQSWSDAYGVDFTPVQRTTDATLRRQRLSPHLAKSWQAVCDPVRLLAIDLAAPHAIPPELVVGLPSEGPRPNGILVFFEAQLSPSVRLSTRPSGLDAESSWTSPLWLLPTVGPPPTMLRFRFEARRRIRLDWPG